MCVYIYIYQKRSVARLKVSEARSGERDKWEKASKKLFVTCSKNWERRGVPPVSMGTAELWKLIYFNLYFLSVSIS